MKSKKTSNCTRKDAADAASLLDDDGGDSCAGDMDVDDIEELLSKAESELDDILSNSQISSECTFR